MSDLAVLQEKLGYEFKDITLLERALTHSTVAEKDYQKLEFLGDALLDFVVADYLLLTYPEESEDFATRKRASVVSRYPLADFFEENRLIDYFRYKNISAKQMSLKLKSDVVEAIIGGIYRDGGLIAARKFIEEKICLRLQFTSGEEVKDYKSRLYEYGAKNKAEITFEHREEGEDHNKTFYSFVLVNGVELGGGFGKKKVIADQIAAKVALERLKCIK